MSVRKHTYTYQGQPRTTGKYYLYFRDHSDVRRCLPGFEDRRATLALERRLKTLVGLRVGRSPLDPDMARWMEALPDRIRAKLAAWDLVDPSRVTACSLLDTHLDDFEAYLKARGTTAQYVRLTVGRVKKVLDAAKCRTWSDITGSRIQEALGGLLTGKTNPRPLGTTTWNYHLGAVRQFCKWMVEERRASESPIAHLRRRRVETKSPRRALVEEEIQKLLTTTAREPERYGMSGAERALAYWLVLESGLRSAEIRSLRRSSFHLDDEQPRLVVEAGYSKRRKTETMFLRPVLVNALRQHLSDRLPAAPAFHLPISNDMAKMLREDLAAAGIEPDDEDGRVDFHSLRHTFISRLARSGVHPKLAQILARHASISLTMNTYTHAHVEDELRALDSLPELGLPTDALTVAVGTGTMGDPLLVPPLVPEGGADATTCDKEGLAASTSGPLETRRNAPQSPRKAIPDAKAARKVADDGAVRSTTARIDCPPS